MKPNFFIWLSFSYKQNVSNIEISIGSFQLVESFYVGSLIMVWILNTILI